jgi:citronellol/citronellal dehydrogenase
MFPADKLNPPSSLKNKILFITGGSRGIGRAISLKAARDGARIAIAAKTIHPHPKLEGTIFSVAKEIEAAGGEALPLQMDIREEEQIIHAVEETVKIFGGIDILVNNASAISLTPTLETEMKKFDLMFHINVRGTFATSKACLPYLKKASNPHILTLSPPLNLKPSWFSSHIAYTISKYGMSMCVLGMAEEFKQEKIAVNALWPRTVIATAAARMLGGEEMLAVARKPEIVADAAYIILNKASHECSGNFFIDEEVLSNAGIKNLESYSMRPGSSLLQDFFLD